MNSQRTKQHICKPRHTSRCFSLQKSCFLADAPANIDKFAVARYKNDNLNISEACDTLKDMPDLVNKIIDVVADYLKKNNFLKGEYNENYHKRIFRKRFGTNDRNLE